MKTTELTDIYGDALTITQRLDATWITCTKGDDEVTIGPIPTDAIRNAFDQPMGGDDMDGGVTAALIEAEVVSPDRARSLVDENAHLRDLIERAETYAAEAIAEAQAETTAAVTAQEKAEQERDAVAEESKARAECIIEQQKMLDRSTLTADDITDDGIARARAAWLETATANGIPSVQVVRAMFAAALTEPPARPEGAEQLDPLVDRAIRGCSDITSPETVRAIANGLAEEGVLAPGAES